ncbi:uncharacterized protein K02A2.6-like [Eupeodes corollae]|uniref:uncharacterized protein K02A2.6-like n=1 Tax=Eupeodes corollae TaxID=290404 RepID=UPI002490FB11|nr:uncharacterized protein K02A2.6-like [Eupeodes corollae]
MGMDWFQEFGLHIQGANSDSVLQIGPDSKDQLLTDAMSLCKQHESVFKSELGCSKFYEAHLTMKSNCQPKYFKYRPVPFAQKKAVQQELERLRKLDILRPIESSQWAAPIVVVKKPNGTLRICGDFKITINPHLEIDRHPVPRIEELFQKLQGGRYFTKIDLSDAYLQIPLDKESKKVCLNWYLSAIYEPTNCQFGFLRLVPRRCIVSGRTNEEHLKNLKIFLERLENHGLRCRLAKCQFAKTEVEYLGHIIDATGIRPSETRIKAIINLPEPKHLKDLEAFIGKINYSNKFIDNFAQIAAPLNKLRAKDEDFVWGKEQQNSFNVFKEKISNISRLTHFQDDLPITLATDASSHGIGAVISHIYPDGSEKPIAFASKTLDASQKGYSHIAKEALSIIFGVTKFQQFLHGRQFELITDHQPLVTFFSPSKKLPHMTIQRLQRWAIFLMGYTYTIRYRPTTKHGNADCLSRLPSGPDEEFDKSEESCHQVDDNISALEDFPINSYVIAKFSKNDPDIRKVIEYIQQGWPARLPATQNSLLPYFRRRLCLSVSANILLFQSQSPRVVIPSALQPKVLTLLHQGHWGVTRMKQMARRYCWWPKVDDIIESTVAKCIACQSNANRSPKEYSSWTTSENVWERIHIDFAGPFQKSMWLIVVDSNSKFPFVIRMSSTTSQATIHALRSIFALEGLPKVIVSDNGTQFTSKEFQQFCQDHSIRQMTSPPFNPESNGLAERMVRTFKTAFLKIMTGDTTDDDALATFLSTFRTTPAEMGISPAEKLHGRPHRTLLSAMIPEPKRSIEPNQPKFRTGQSVYLRQYLKGKNQNQQHDNTCDDDVLIDPDSCPPMVDLSGDQQTTTADTPVNSNESKDGHSH